MQKKILIVDDHVVVRLGVEILLKDEINNFEIYEAENFSQCLDKISKDKFDLVILDIHLPDGKRTEMIKDIKSIQDIKVLIFSAHEEVNVASNFLKAGANGFVSKFVDEKKLLSAIHAILSGENFFDADVIKYSNSHGFDSFEEILSSRELEVANLLVQGFGNLEISNELNIKMSTVSTYKTRIFEKLKVLNTIELASLFKTYQF
ncbi:response regulator transcription factor [Flavobacterium sp. NRK F10]|uniref:response regulator transcription factor n=1 Tax=Flavobacterium sp. NRK F10 TaxID=2954931 RepID=UPI0020912518|nr:response regulator transcription factor [Flavobacterium sp. NRK F10]MCO6173419.1 response regulator transcription factor [Flavobacterium sp. NRK F10]